MSPKPPFPLLGLKGGLLVELLELELGHHGPLVPLSVHVESKLADG